MLVVFPPIFMVDTKIVYGNNFVAPLSFENQTPPTGPYYNQFALRQLWNLNQKLATSCYVTFQAKFFY